GKLNITLVEINKFDHPQAFSLCGKGWRQNGGLHRISLQGCEGLREPTQLNNCYVFDGNQAPPLEGGPGTEVCGRSESSDSNALASQVSWLLNRRASDNGKCEPTHIGDQYKRVRPADAGLNGWNAGTN